MTKAGFRAMKGGVDLNGESRFAGSSRLSPGGRYESWQAPFRPAHGLPAVDNICSVRAVIWRRTVLPMDQAASAYQEVLRHFRECREVANLDCRVGLCPRRYHHKTSQPRRFALLFATGFVVGGIGYLFVGKRWRRRYFLRWWSTLGCRVTLNHVECGG